MTLKTKQENLTLKDTREIIEEINAQSQKTGQRRFDRVYRVATFCCEQKNEQDVIVEIRYSGDTAENYQCVAMQRNGTVIAKSAEVSQLRTAIKEVAGKLNVPAEKAE